MPPVERTPLVVLIRADASARIGIGHVRRCLTLARALADHGCVVRFATCGEGVALASLLAEFGHNAILLPAGDDADFYQSTWARNRQLRDFDALAAAWTAAPPNWVVVDHYGLDAVWHEAARARWGCAILAIDDLADRSLAADVLVDHNWHWDHRAKYREWAAPTTILLGGPRYALIDAQFSSGPRPATGSTVESVGIFMGGTDPTAISGTVLHLLRQQGFAGPVEIVSTSLNAGLVELRDSMAGDQASRLTLDRPDLFDFFRQHDLFILAAGGTTWERMASAAAAIAIVTVANQREIADQLAADGLQWTVTAGDWPTLRELLASLLHDASSRRAIADRGRALVDGRGAERVALALVTAGDATVSMRRATMNDAERVFEWRNDPAIRSVSRNSRVLDLGAHCTWFATTIASPDRLLLIGEKGDIPVGMVRFDRCDADTYEISIVVSPMLAGLRLGDAMLAAAQAELVRLAGRDVVILAETLPDNRASQRLFQRAGYRQNGRRFRLELSRLWTSGDETRS